MYICDSRWYIPSTYTKEPASLTNNRDHCRSSCTTGDLYEIRSGIERSEIDGNWVLAACSWCVSTVISFPETENAFVSTAWALARLTVRLPDRHKKSPLL